MEHNSKLWNGGENHVIIDLGMHSTISYQNNRVPFTMKVRRCITTTTGKAMLWKSNMGTKDFRDNFDVVVPLGLNRGIPIGSNGTWAKYWFVLRTIPFL